MKPSRKQDVDSDEIRRWANRCWLLTYAPGILIPLLLQPANSNGPSINTSNHNLASSLHSLSSNSGHLSDHTARPTGNEAILLLNILILTCCFFPWETLRNDAVMPREVLRLGFWYAALSQLNVVMPITNARTSLIVSDCVQELRKTDSSCLVSRGSNLD